MLSIWSTETTARRRNCLNHQWQQVAIIMVFVSWIKSIRNIYLTMEYDTEEWVWPQSLQCGLARMRRGFLFSFFMTLRNIRNSYSSRYWLCNIGIVFTTTLCVMMVSDGFVHNLCSSVCLCVSGQTTIDWFTINIKIN